MKHNIDKSLSSNALASVDGGLGLAGDDVNEPIEHDARLVLILRVLQQRLGDLIDRGTDRDVVECLVIGRDIHIGGADEEPMRVSTIAGKRLGESERIPSANSFLHRLLVGHRVLLPRRLLTIEPLVAEKVEPDGIGLGAITEDAKQSLGRVVRSDRGLVGLTSDRINDVTLGLVERIRVGKIVATRLTIREEDRIDDLKLVRSAELRHHVHRSDDALIERSRTEVILRRDQIGAVERSSVCETEHIVDAGLPLVTGHTRRQEVQEHERAERSRGGLTEFVLGPEILAIEARTGSVGARRCDGMVDGAGGEGVDLERNVDLAAEESENHELLHGIHENRRHRRRPVDIHDESVALAISNNGIATEDVFAELVRHHANRVNDTAASNRGALRTICRLAHLKLLHHVADDGSRFCHERDHDGTIRLLATLQIMKPAGLHRTVCTTEDLVSIRFHVTGNILVVPHDVVEIRRIENTIGNTASVATVLIHALIEGLLRERTRRNLRHGLTGIETDRGLIFTGIGVISIILAAVAVA